MLIIDGRIVHRTLSSREWDVVRLIAMGLGNEAIAASLVLELSTVDGHIWRIYQQFDWPNGSHKRVSLANWCHEVTAGAEVIEALTNGAVVIGERSSELSPLVQPRASSMSRSQGL